MGRLARAVVRHPSVVVVVWVVGAAAIIHLGPAYSSVPQASISLPQSSPANRAASLESARFGRGDQRPTATVVTEDLVGAAALRGWLGSVPDVAQGSVR